MFATSFFRRRWIINGLDHVHGPRFDLVEDPPDVLAHDAYADQLDTTEKEHGYHDGRPTLDCISQGPLHEYASQIEERQCRGEVSEPGCEPERHR